MKPGRYKQLAPTVVVLLVMTQIQADGKDLSSLEEARERGARKSSYMSDRRPSLARTSVPKADLDGFRHRVAPLLRDTCLRCHGPDKQKAGFRIDTLDPDLVTGPDGSWWLEVMEVITSGEMPPEDEEVQFSDAGQALVVNWLSQEIQVASQVARVEDGNSSFRRMTRYEYNYSIQDLLGLDYQFAADLPPETKSKDGFLNSSEMLQMTASQFQTYRELARDALRKATVSGDQPGALFLGVSMESLLQRNVAARDAKFDKFRRIFADEPEKLKQTLEREVGRWQGNDDNTHFLEVGSDRRVRSNMGFTTAVNAPRPVPIKPEPPLEFSTVAVVPPGQSLEIQLRDELPDSGAMRVRVFASQHTPEGRPAPEIRLNFGHQSSANSRAEEQVGRDPLSVTALPGDAQIFTWDFPLEEVVRNQFRGVKKLGKVPNPGEFVKVVNASSESHDSIQVRYVEVALNAFEQWPPASHTRILPEVDLSVVEEEAYAQKVLKSFMWRAWRRPVTAEEVEGKMALYKRLRPSTADAQEALIEVMAGILSSSKFLYVGATAGSKNDLALAERLSFFLWSSIPDWELLELAYEGKLRERNTLVAQTRRLLADPRADRFSHHFVRQWLGMDLLDYLQVDEDVYKNQFDEELRSAMLSEPTELFRELLRENHSIVDFLHSDYLVVNERLANHYGIPNVYGSEFRRVALTPGVPRGGLLTQAGLLAMNSDGTDSHPLKRGIWLLESILHDPPPPAPPAVPEVDLSDPEVLKMTLKERMEDHRNSAACHSCHAKIDPWGIAFENFDAVGGWRDTIKGRPVDASGVLYSGDELDGVSGLKRYLLENRQDQFAHAMVHKLCSYALGRPLNFSDRSALERITTQLRQNGDGLETLVILIVISDLFQSV